MKHPNRTQDPTCIGRVQCLFVLLVLVSLPSLAQEGDQPDRAQPHPQPSRTEGSPRPGDKIGWHVVKTGECLETITEKYLGYGQLWRENWRLNPNIVNPHKLKPGQRIRVILERRNPRQSAEVVVVRRRVERQTVPDPWMPAFVGDRLVERDSLRTLKQAFSKLKFEDGTTLQVTEESMIFLHTVGQSLVGVHREAVEIIAGQADLKARFEQKRPSEIEVILGDARARPEPDPNGAVATRTRLKSAGRAEVMVFAGAAEVAAQGSAVKVDKGMGTVVSRGEAPKPPSKLLSQPDLLTPSKGARFAYRNPEFSWAEVDGAAHYTIEVCEDADCSQPVVRHTDITSTRWKSQGLVRGHLYWRVTATDASGLDGYPSRSRPLEISGDVVDRDAPHVVAVLVGAGETFGDAIILGPGGAIQLFAYDDASGVATIRYRWDTGNWQEYEGQPINLPSEKSSAELQIQAIDHTDAASQIHAIAVTRDTQPPSPPRLQR